MISKSLVEMGTTILQGRTFPCIQVEACYQQEHGVLHVSVSKSAGPWNSRGAHKKNSHHVVSYQTVP
ncbi:hypothetical protein J4Q44_G00145150 [Coregonus suidteri]|uniref:Uncharacterized protein n=1 Tax=Coregonus suidteri TaxID=861788 RepID=A0AAN8M9N5_9TELE